MYVMNKQKAMWDEELKIMQVLGISPLLWHIRYKEQDGHQACTGLIYAVNLEHAQLIAGASGGVVVQPDPRLKKGRNTLKSINPKVIDV